MIQNRLNPHQDTKFVIGIRYIRNAFGKYIEPQYQSTSYIGFISDNNTPTNYRLGWVKNLKEAILFDNDKAALDLISKYQYEIMKGIPKYNEDTFGVYSFEMSDIAKTKHINSRA